jgi:hypothetical protein
MKRKESMRDSYARRLKEGLVGKKAVSTPPKRLRPAGGHSELKRVPLRKVSARRQKEQKVYTDRRNTFMAENPTCMARLEGCEAMATECHHSRGRAGKNYTDTSTFKALCGNCHHLVHAFPNKARELGLLF